MNKVNKLVSVVSPMFNVEKFIVNFIESIIAQTYNQWELILVDDGSADKTVEIVQGYTVEDERIKLFHRGDRPKGANACRNIGMNNAKGEFIVILDSDDVVEHFCLEQRVNLLLQNPDASYLTVKGGEVSETLSGDLVVKNKQYGNNPHRDLICCLLSSDYPFGVWNNIYVTNEILDCAWDENVAVYQDFDFMLTVALKGKKHIYAENSKIDYWYRTGRQNAITSSFISKSKHVSTIYLFRKVQQQLENNPKASEYKKWFKKYYILQFIRVLKQGDCIQKSEFYKLAIENYKDIRFKVLFLLFGKGNNINMRLITVASLAVFNPKELFLIVFKFLGKQKYKKDVLLLQNKITDEN